MKSRRRTIALFLTIVMIINFSILGAVQALAHEAVLNVEYDSCDKAIASDGINEKWYVLYDRRKAFENSKCYHLSHETQTIKYYFADESPTGYRWDTDISEELAEEIKTDFANSMKKWNNVYFYSYDSDDNVVKNKVINIVEGTLTDNNLVIYPYFKNGNTFAHTDYDRAYSENIETFTDVKKEHNHVSKWFMNVYIGLFYINPGVTESVVNNARNGTGAHEIGHVLGLRDIDNLSLCGAGTADEHHEELLMGYGDISRQVTDITYKDIAGVAITRGFHTDSDHKWLYAGQQADGTYKLICSICNGVKYVDSLSGYSYNTYNACNGNHTLSSGNMMAVASYGTSDYYKCRYCRYVAPFSEIVPQNYSITNHSSTLHKYTSNVNGLNYSFYEEHSFTYNKTASTHTITCICGYTVTENHTFTYKSISDGFHSVSCSKCNYTYNEAHTMVKKNNIPIYCSKCQYVCDNSFYQPYNKPDEEDSIN